MRERERGSHQDTLGEKENIYVALKTEARENTGSQTAGIKKKKMHEKDDTRGREDKKRRKAD